jgi:glutathione S-transferase
MKLHYAETINARKACVTAKHLNVPLTFVRVDFSKNEQSSPPFLALNPNGKVPVLELDDGHTLWESNAIVCHLARQMGSDLYPTDERQIDMIRWLSWSSEHFNRYAFRIYFENLVKPMFGLGAPNAAGVEEASGFIRKSGAILNDHLKGRRYILGDRLTITDFIVGISLPYAEAAKIPLNGFTEIARWADRLNELPAWRDPFPATKAAA